MEREQLIKKLSDLYPNRKIQLHSGQEVCPEAPSGTNQNGELCNEAGIKICSCELGCF